nr:hypothetical protein CFP56_74197 [Quercus suber]
MTRFSKQKLAEAHEKKAKGGTVSGLLSKKKASDISKKDPVIMPPPTHSPAKCPSSLTSSLEMIAYGGEEIRKKKKASGKSFLPTFWDNADVAALKAHEALSVDDLSPLMAKSSSEVMSSHIQEPVQDKQIGDLELKLENVGATVVQDFKDSDRYSDELCKYYIESFDLLVKWMAKHHPGLDLSGLAVDDVEQEFMSDQPFKATTENVTEEAIDIAK